MKQDSKQSGLTLLQYDIADSNKIFGQGNINTIKGQFGSWKPGLGAQRVKLTFHLRSICKLSKIQMKICDANMMSIVCYNDQEEIFNDLKIFNSKQRENKEKIEIVIKKNQAEIDSIQLDIDSYSKRQMQVISIRFYGMIIRKKILKNGLNKKHLEVFQERVKTSAYKNERNRQQEQQEKIQQKKIPSKSIPEEESSDIDEQQEQIEVENEEELEQKPPNYKVLTIKQSQLENIVGINEKWLECQRQFQSRFGVKFQHKLSIKLNPKCLTNAKLLIVNIYAQEKAKYVKMAKQLGASIKQELTQGCIVVTPHPKGNTVKLAKLMDGVAIVKLSYLQQCYRLKTKLKPTKFQFTQIELIGL